MEVVDNFPPVKTTWVLLAMQEPHKAVTDKAEVAATELVEAVVAVGKMVVQVVDYLVVTTVAILGKTVTVWLLVVVLLQPAATEEYPMVQADRVALLSVIIPKSF